MRISGDVPVDARAHALSGLMRASYERAVFISKINPSPTYVWQRDDDIGVPLPPVDRLAYRQRRDGQIRLGSEGRLFLRLSDGCRFPEKHVGSRAVALLAPHRFVACETEGET